MSYQSVIQADAPRSYWRFSETSGNSAADTMGHLPGWWDNDFTLGNPGPPVIGDTAAAINNGAVGDDAFYAPTNAGVAGTAFTAPAPPFSIEIWVKISVSTGGVLVQFNNAYQFGGASYDRTLMIDTTGKVVWMIFVSASVFVTSSVTVNDGNWHHIVAVIQSTGNMQLYIDGSLTNGASNTNTGTPVSYTGYWRIGAGNQSISGVPNQPTQTQPQNASLSSAAYYTTALSAAQVLRHYNAGTQTTPPTQPHRMPLGV